MFDKFDINKGKLNQLYKKFCLTREEFWENISNLNLYEILSGDNENLYQLIDILKKINFKKDYKKKFKDLCLRDFKDVDSNYLLFEIRNLDGHYESYKENLAKLLKEVYKNLKEFTFGYIDYEEDYLESIVSKKLFDYEEFLNLLDTVPLRTKLVAKILYFLDDIEIDDVMNLKIEDFLKGINILMVNNKIHFCRLFSKELEQVVGNRKKGNLFIGRQGKPLNCSTVFRDFRNYRAKYKKIISPFILQLKI